MSSVWLSLLFLTYGHLGSLKRNTPSQEGCFCLHKQDIWNLKQSFNLQKIPQSDKSAELLRHGFLHLCKFQIALFETQICLISSAISKQHQVMSKEHQHQCSFYTPQYHNHNYYHFRQHQEQLDLRPKTTDFALYFSYWLKLSPFDLLKRLLPLL